MANEFVISGFGCGVLLVVAYVGAWCCWRERSGTMVPYSHATGLQLLAGRFG